MLIRLPSERGEQLAALAKTWNLTTTDAIGRLLNGAIEAGHLPRGVPGVEFDAPHNGTVTLRVRGFRLQAMTAIQLRDAASAIRKIVSEGGVMMNCDVPDFLTVKAAGPGISIAFTRATGDGIKITVARSVALDIASEFERHAEELTKH